MSEQPDGFDGDVTVVVDGEPPRTAHAARAARFEVVERDVWGNSRVRGLGRPPFPVELLDGATG